MPLSMSLNAFYLRLSESSPQASILSIILDHMKNFIPQLCSKDFPISISALYDSKYLDVPYDKLLQECEKVFDKLCVSSEQSSIVEIAYKGLSKIKALVLSPLWKNYCFKVQGSCAYRCCNAFTVPI